MDWLEIIQEYEYAYTFKVLGVNIIYVAYGNNKYPTIASETTNDLSILLAFVRICGCHNIISASVLPTAAMIPLMMNRHAYM